MEEILVSLQYFFYKIYSLLFTNNIAFIFKNQIVKKFLCLPLVLFKGCCKVKDFNDIIHATCSEIVTMNDIAAENHFL